MSKEATIMMLVGVVIGVMGFAAYLNHTAGSRVEILEGIQCVADKLPAPPTKEGK